MLGPSVEPSHTPRSLGKYRLLRLLARGGMGEVHLAKLPGELGFEKLLVVKTIRADLAAKPRFVELFAAEAKTAVALRHPNITPIYELGRADDGTLYTAMGWVDGPSLAALLERLRARDRPLELGPTLYIGREILDGLAHAHAPDGERPPVVHRDITPRNVLIDRSGRVQIVDFGIALAAEAPDEPDEPDERPVMGSVGYMSPEQARGDPVDPRADVFAVACVLYELASNQRAFPSEGVWMSPDLGVLPEPLRVLFTRALALDPEDRFADAGEFLHALTPALAEYAPAYAARDLAAVIDELFPGGWSADPTSPDPEGSTPVTRVPRSTRAFATRPIEPSSPTPPAAAGGPSPALAGRENPVGSSTHAPRPTWIWIALTFAALVGLWAVSQGRGSERARGSESPLRSTSEPSTGPVQAPHGRSSSPRRLAAELPAPKPAEAPPPPAFAPRPVELRVTPAQATVRLDGELVEGPPHLLELSSEGPHTLQVEHRGHASEILELDPAGLDDAPLVVNLTPLGEGELTVVAPTVAWAEVRLDGEKLGSTPLTGEPVLEGKHRLEIVCTEAVCGRTRTLVKKTIQIRADRHLKITAQD